MIRNSETGDFDAIVVGGGPAGSVAGAALGRAGRRVLILERERFPRFHIGESLLPRTAPALEEIGVLDRLEREGFTRKWGASFLTADGTIHLRADFRDSGWPRHAHHVLRERFDEVLLQHARECGAEVREGCRAREVRLDLPGGGVEVTYEHDGGAAQARGAVLIDASGRQGFLARRLDLREVDPGLRKVAVYGHFEGVDGLAGDAAGDIRLVSRADLSWLWLIPLAGGRTSVGAVFDHDAHPSGADPGDTLARIVAETPAVSAAMTGARACGAARFEGDFSYTVRAYAGDRWLLAGDAGSFLDPVFSTGVHLAVHGGLAAARAVLSGRPGALRAYDRDQRRLYRFWRRFVTGFYDPGFRDLLFQPAASNRLYRAVVSILSGNDRPGWWTRSLVGVFLALARLQGRVPLVPRIHRGEP